MSFALQPRGRRCQSERLPAKLIRRNQEDGHDFRLTCGADHRFVWSASITEPRPKGAVLAVYCWAMTWLLALFGLCAVAAQAHDIITTAITWDREISRLVYSHCAGCHHSGGMAFSLMTYKEARPWAEAIKEEVIARRMPPWGAIKGFGDFRNDQALTPEEMEIVVSWADGGVPEGEDKDLPPPPKLDAALAAEPSKGDFIVDGEITLAKPLLVDGLWPRSAPEQGSFQIVAVLPDGSIQPMLWLQDYKRQFAHPFLFRKPIELPAGTVIQGVPSGAEIALLKPRPQPPPEQTKTASNKR